MTLKINQKLDKRDIAMIIGEANNSGLSIELDSFFEYDHTGTIVDVSRSKEIAFLERIGFKEVW